MKVSELIGMLQDYDEDAEVRLATQPSYPLQAHIKGVADSTMLEDYDEEEGSDSLVVWILEGSQPRDTPYASRELWDAAY